MYTPLRYTGQHVIRFLTSGDKLPYLENRCRSLQICYQKILKLSCRYKFILSVATRLIKLSEIKNKT